MYSDAWLRLNPNNAFTSGIYAGTGILRTDGNLQVGNAGATLNVSGASFTYLSNSIWHAGNDGSGSGLDADKLDGLHADSANTVSTVVSRDASGNFSAGTITASLSGNANTASSLATARTITLDGDVSGNVSFNGSADVTITTAVADDSHNHTNSTGNYTVGGMLIVEGSGNSGTTDYAGYRSDATNIVLKGDASGRSSIFFQSEKNGVNINHPTDYAYIQYHPYGIDGSTGEANRLVIGVANDTDDMVVLQSPYKNGVKISYKDATAGIGGTEYTVWHAGNDGSGSGLDADLLDGQQGSYYLDASNINAGTLALTRGGTNASLTAVAGAVAYSNSTSIALTAVGTSGYVLLSGGTSTPTWSSQASLSVGTANNVSGGTVTATSGTFSGTLGVTGAATFANTVGITGTLTPGVLHSTSGTLSGTLGVTGATTFSNTVGVTGALTATSGRITKELEIGNTSIYANTQTISTASSNTIIDAFYTSEYSTSKYVIAYKSTSNTVVFGSTEILVMHNGSTVITSEYSTMYGTDIAFSVDAAIVGSNCNIYASANQGNLVISTTRFSMV